MNNISQKNEHRLHIVRRRASITKQLYVEGDIWKWDYIWRRTKTTEIMMSWGRNCISIGQIFSQNFDDFIHQFRTWNSFIIPYIFLGLYWNEIVIILILDKFSMTAHSFNLEVFKTFRFNSSMTSSIFDLIEFDSSLFIDLDPQGEWKCPSPNCCLSLIPATKMMISLVEKYGTYTAVNGQIRAVYGEVTVKNTVVRNHRPGSTNARETLWEHMQGIHPDEFIIHCFH